MDVAVSYERQMERGNDEFNKMADGLARTVQARQAAQQAAVAESQAAKAAMEAMEQCLSHYAETKHYLKLKATAEASDIAAKVPQPDPV